MALEVYQTRFGVQLSRVHVTAQFYWLVDNTTGQHSWEVSRDVQNNLFLDTDWVFYLLGFYSEKCFLRRFTTCRRKPKYGPSYSVRYTSDLFRGRAVGQLSDNFITCNVRWHYAGDFIGKCQNRFGPLNAGAEDTFYWSNFCQLNASAFIAEHLAIRTTAGGLSFQSVALTQSGIVFPLSSGELMWPPGRQKNRRLAF